MCEYTIEVNHYTFHLHDFTYAHVHAYTYAGCDYAHDSTGFLSWHRLYLLWLERELQILSGNEGFRLSYWNWTDFEGESDWRGLLFNDNRLGGYDSDGKVTGPYFNADNWNTICVGASNEICDPRKSTGGLVRCPLGHHCTSSNNGWPTRADIDTALAKGSFSDSSVFNKYSENNFANYVEGYVPIDVCGTLTLCSDDKKSNVSFNRKLHNVVSRIKLISSVRL